MSEKLTLEEIAEAEERAAGWLDGPHHGATVTRETALSEEHLAFDVQALAQEVRETRATHLELDDYEAANLLWLLKVSKALGLDSGDWHGQIVKKLLARGCGSPVATEPNFDVASTVTQLGASCIPIEKLASRVREALQSYPLQSDSGTSTGLRDHFWALYKLWTEGSLTWESFCNELALEGFTLAEASASFDARTRATVVIDSYTKKIVKNRFGAPPR